MKDKDIKRLEAELDYLRAKMAEAIRDRKFARASELMRRVSEKDAELADAYANAKIVISDLVDASVLDEHQVNDLILETILAVDFANDCFCNLRSALAKAGVKRSECDDYAQEMESLTRRYTNRFVDGRCVGLSLFITSNEDLVDDMHKAVRGYIHEHLNTPSES